MAEAIAQVLAVPLREMEEKNKMKLPELPKTFRNPFAKKKEEEDAVVAPSMDEEVRKQENSC